MYEPRFRRRRRGGSGMRQKREANMEERAGRMREELGTRTGRRKGSEEGRKGAYKSKKKKDVNICGK